MIEKNLDKTRHQIDQLALKVGQEIFERDAPGNTISFMDWDDSHEQARSEKYQRVEERLDQMKAEAFRSGAPLGAAVGSALEIAERYTKRRDEPLTPSMLVDELSSQRRYNIAADPVEFHPLSSASAERLQALPLGLIRKAEKVILQSTLPESSRTAVKLVLTLTDSYRREHTVIPAEAMEGVSELYQTVVYCLDHASTEAFEPTFRKEVIVPTQTKLLERFPGLSPEVIAQRADRIRLHMHHLPDVETGWESKAGSYDKATSTIHLSINDRRLKTDSHEVLHGLSLEPDSPSIQGLDFFSAKLLEEAVIESTNGELGAADPLSYPNERSYLKALLTWQHDLLRDIPQPGENVKPLSLDVIVEMTFGDRDLPKLLHDHGYSDNEADRFLRITQGLFRIAQLQQDERMKTGKRYSDIQPQWAEEFRRSVA